MIEQHNDTHSHSHDRFVADLFLIFFAFVQVFTRGPKYSNTPQKQNSASQFVKLPRRVSPGWMSRLLVALCWTRHVIFAGFRPSFVVFTAFCWQVSCMQTRKKRLNNIPSFLHYLLLSFSPKRAHKSFEHLHKYPPNPLESTSLQKKRFFKKKKGASYKSFIFWGLNKHYTRHRTSVKKIKLQTFPAVNHFIWSSGGEGKLRLL